MKKTILTLLMAATLTVPSMSDDEMPDIRPTAYYTTADGSEEESADYSGSAPLKGRFVANPTNADGWSATYEWRFSHEEDTEPYLVRYEEDTEYTFTRAGSHSIVLYATFTRGEERVEFLEEYWSGADALRVSVSESSLDMPNAFSPNGDGRNEEYKAKSYNSLIEFHATIFNRWGQKLFEWDDPSKGWDGKHNGTPVKQGVYFVLVEAKGADGRRYRIKRDVNLIRGYTSSEGDSNSTGE